MENYLKLFLNAVRSQKNFFINEKLGLEKGQLRRQRPLSPSEYLEGYVMSRYCKTSLY